MRGCNGREGERHIVGGLNVADEMPTVEATHRMGQEIDTSPRDLVLQ